MAMVLGCIADDFTGATDLANNLVRAGMRVIQTIGVPDKPLSDAVDAVVVALKSRTIAPELAVEQSLAALHWLQAQGAQQVYFKVCSTFDSTAKGNIGPVTEALMDAMGVDFCIATPAFPDNKRSVFKGHLFVGDVLLNESGMQNHPLTPMTDANLQRVMQAQTRRKVGLIDHSVVAQGAQAIEQRIAQLRKNGIGVAIVDAISNHDLYLLGPALKTHRLMTAGSGVAIALPANFGIQPSGAASLLPRAGGRRAVVSGSCSLATQSQVQHFMAQGGAAWRVDTTALLERATDSAAGGAMAASKALVQQALSWAATQKTNTVLLYSTANAEEVKASQRALGVDASGALVEDTLSAIARGLVEQGVGQLIVAGGETSGACVQALGVSQLQIGAQIDPGVPWCYAVTTQGPVHLSLKSGNFGSEDFFSKAFGLLSS